VKYRIWWQHPQSVMTFLRIVITLYLFDLSMISAQTRSAFVS